jgi:dUTP pyrophosphatase
VRRPVDDLETVRIRLLSGGARMPRRGSSRSAGYDLFAASAVSIPGSTVRADGRVVVGRALVPTGLAMAIPRGLYGRIAPRSGLAVRNGIDVGAGVIDGDYRDELKLLLFNFAPDSFEIAEGDRVAQIIFERVAEPELVEVDELDGEDRGGGFGSTGLR